ncbi:hypothetical protein Pan44_20640 [Caulifigura coniformis]|uniref:DUF4159 domain-containing protein n=1 Tax=Caulifigura coniformis TaxID=2527983 RepID=A0A517SD48_9PLAN|nr:DUF4159 domain-containing protein [Caulifigura coniformis]QDT54037.1 hypothetical protein Pan44_20640 [Caulifigura coniformis]
MRMGNRWTKRAIALGACLGAATLWAEEPRSVIQSLNDAFPGIQIDPDANHAVTPEEAANAPGPLQPGVVNCAILTYGNGKTSRCFSSEFLAQASRETNIRTNPRFVSTALESSDLFKCPFAILTGEGKFALTEAQRLNLRNYLENGGFIIASAGCSNEDWHNSFRAEIEKTFADAPLKTLDPSHAVFHTVYDIHELRLKGSRRAHLEGLEIDGRIALIFSPDGLNDTGKAGPKCCCCGGNEVQNARQVNVNLLAYTLTH